MPVGVLRHDRRLVSIRKSDNPSGEGKHFLNDVECYSVVRNCHMWTLIITASYLLVDTVFVLECVSLR